MSQSQKGLRQLLQEATQLLVDINQATITTTNLSALALGVLSDADGTLRDLADTVEAIEKVVNRIRYSLAQEAYSRALSTMPAPLPAMSGTLYSSRLVLEQSYVIPTEGSRYEAMCDQMGIQEQYRDRGKKMSPHQGEVPTEVVKVSYKGMQAQLRELAATNNPLPTWVDDNKFWFVPKLITRAKSRK
jgi:hypothetical protein